MDHAITAAPSRRLSRTLFRFLLPALLAAITATSSWAADGTWTGFPQALFSGIPSNRHGHSLTIDGDTQQLIVFGGFATQVGHSLDDTWVGSLAGLTDFQMVPTGGGPGARYGHAAVYDPVRKRTLIVGGDDASISTMDVWAFTPSPPHWTALPPLGLQPPKLRGTATVYDPVRDRLLVFGGFGGYDTTYAFRNDLYSYSFATLTWEIVSVAGTPPSPRDYASIVYDPVADRLVLFGGNDGIAKNDAYTLDLTANPPVWSPLATTGGPPLPRLASGTVYDPASGAMILFGGVKEGPVYYDDLWSLDLATATWTTLPQDVHPSVRHSVGMVCDAAANRIVMFGGESMGVSLDQLWTYDLSSHEWTWNLYSGFDIILPFVPPQPRYGHVIGHDGVNHLMLTFGGFDQYYSVISNSVYGLKLDPPQGMAQMHVLGSKPAPLQGATFTEDAPRHRLLLFGGFDPKIPLPPLPPLYKNDLWELALAPNQWTWHHLSPIGPPPSPRDYHSATLDPTGQQLIVIGGNGVGGARNDVWSLDLATLAWTELAPAGTPPAPRLAHGAALDAAGNRIIVYGGIDSVGTVFGDVWALNLSPLEWVPLSPGGASPGPRHSMGFQLDPSHQRIVMHGGSDGVTGLSSTYSLSLTEPIDWTPLSIPGAPDGRYGHAFIYDPGTDQFVMDAGFELPPGYSTNETWLLKLNDVATAVTASLGRFEARSDGVHMGWSGAGAAGQSAVLERSESAGPWSEMATLAFDASGQASYVDASVVAGHRYGYRLSFRDGGATTTSWIEIPGLMVHVEGFAPNPARGAPNVAFTLADASPARLEVIDVAGRMVETRTLSGLQPGRHVIDLAGSRLGPGLYFIRLSQGGTVSTARGIKVR